MTLSAELILGAMVLIFLTLSAKEYFTNGQIITLKIKAWLRIVAIFLLVLGVLSVRNKM